MVSVSWQGHTTGLPLTQDIQIPWLFPDLFLFFPDQSNIEKLRHVHISMISYLNNHYVHDCMFQIANFNEKGKFRMKCFGKYDASASWKILDLLIDHRNLLWNINFLKISLTFHELPWLWTKFPISLTYSKILWLFADLEFPWLFPDQWQPCTKDHQKMV